MTDPTAPLRALKAWANRIRAARYSSPALYLGGGPPWLDDLRDGVRLADDLEAALAAVAPEPRKASKSWLVMCPDCDHGIRGGTVCGTCGGEKTVTVQLAVGPEPDARLRALVEQLRKDLKAVALIGPDYRAAVATLDAIAALLAPAGAPPEEKK